MEVNSIEVEHVHDLPINEIDESQDVHPRCVGCDAPIYWIDHPRCACGMPLFFPVPEPERI